MIKYDSLNVKLSYLQRNKLKSALQNETGVTLRLSSNMVGESNHEVTVPHQLLTDRQAPKFHKIFANNSSANIELSKTQLSEIVQSGGFLGVLLGPLLKTGLPLMKNVVKPFAKSV